MPKAYLEIQRKFNKRAYKELLEVCSDQLTKKTKAFSVMYTIDGEIVEIIDDVPDDC